MPSEIKLEKFQGPLDLLLQLIEQEELKITEVALSEVTEQFLKYLDNLEDNRSEELADFLVIATKLVYLKSRTLLPFLYPEEDEGPSLADQLKMYQQYIEASKKINTLWEAGRISYGRIEPPVKMKEFALPANGRVNDLYEAMVKLVNRLRPANPLPRVTIDRGISVKQRIDDIMGLLKQHKSFSFQHLLSDSKNKTDIIVSFLALLDLLKDQKLHIKQSGNFSEIKIKEI